MHQLIRAQQDASLQARIISRRTLRYTRAAPEAGPHVRASSGLCWLGAKLALVQDDALFLALVDPQQEEVQSLPLPVREDGARLFDKERGNKQDKPDLEACLSFVLDGAPALLGFGSGSRPNRETLLLVQQKDSALEATLLPAPALYAALREQTGLLRTELNLEGAVLLPSGMLRLFQRSNGELLQGSESALCATCDVPFAALLAHVRQKAPLPAPQNAAHYDLGSLGNARLTFTDATLHANDTVLFLASAERSPNAYDDGEVAGSALGLLDETGARLCLLHDEQGQPVRDKAEGITLFPGSRTRAYVAFDPDDHRVPATLCEVALSGF